MHRHRVVEHIGDHVAVMNRGRIEEAGPASTVLEQPQSSYIRTLIAAVPRIAVSGTQYEGLPDVAGVQRETQSVLGKCPPPSGAKPLGDGITLAQNGR